ncbi:MAG: hypothetical protein V3V67_07710 [Myxococcota bacterium]
MASAKPQQKLVSVVSGAEVDGAGLIVRFNPTSGNPHEIEDRIPLAPGGEMPTVYGVGRVVRILRAARIRVPPDPYRFCADPERAAELLRRCAGAVVHLHVARRIERVLTLWTEEGIERIRGVLDFFEDADGLSVRRRQGESVLFFSRKKLIRYEASSQESLEVVSVEVPPRVTLA